MTGMGAAQERLLRLMCFSLGTASIIFLALNSPSVLEGLDLLEPWWSVAFLVVFASGAILLAVGFWILPRRPLMLVCAIHAAVFVAGVALTPLASVTPLSSAPWIFNLAVLGGAGAGVALAGAAGWLYLAAASASMFWVVAVSAEPSAFATPFHVAILNTFFMTLFFCIARATWRAGRLLDEAAESAIAEARSAATVSARAAEDARLKAFVHDSVLVALLAFARSEDPADPRAAEQAQRSLDSMDALDNPPDRNPMNPSELIRALQSLATEIVPDAIFDHEGDAPALVIPPEASQALTEALGEALRNSVVHAAVPGIGVDRRVTVGVSPRSVSVLVRDSGRGFDSNQISLDRLGIRAGIIGRMERVPGGRAVVESRVGAGAAVRLEWSPE